MMFFIQEAAMKTKINPDGLDLLPYKLSYLRVLARSGQLPGVVNRGTLRRPRWMISMDAIKAWWASKESLTGKSFYTNPNDNE